LGGGVGAEEGSFPILERTVIAGSLNGGAVYAQAGSGVTLSCCDLFGNTGGDWDGSIAAQYGVDGNISADPLFCDPDAGDFTLQSGSPCLYSNHPEGWICGLIGADPIGCPASSVPPQAVWVTWGGLKTAAGR
jgi:hypothetical protein